MTTTSKKMENKKLSPSPKPRAPPPPLFTCATHVQIFFFFLFWGGGSNGFYAMWIVDASHGQPKLSNIIAVSI